MKNSPDYVMIGCCNFTTVWGDKSANLKKIKEMTVKAAEIGVNIIAFPELALSGYECESPAGCGKNGMHQRLAETIPGPSTLELAQVAKEHDIYIITGMPGRNAKDPEKIFISAAVVGPEGVIWGRGKLYLSTRGETERVCFTPGKEMVNGVPVFPTRFGLIGVSICAEFWTVPEIPRLQALKGALILFNITASAAAAGGDVPLQMRAVTGGRAAENNAFTASANLAGIDRKKLFYGHSTIAGPDSQRRMRIYAEGGPGEELVTAVLSLKELRQRRQSSAVLREWKDLYTDSFQAEYEKLS